MNTLPLPVHSPAVANPQKAFFELEMPLHVCTDSEAHVAMLVGSLLGYISKVDQEVSHADILQALAITTVVRAAVADAATEKGADFSPELLNIDVLTVSEAAQRAA